MFGAVVLSFSFAASSHAADRLTEKQVREFFEAAAKKESRSKLADPRFSRPGAAEPGFQIPPADKLRVLGAQKCAACHFEGVKSPGQSKRNNAKLINGH